MDGFREAKGTLILWGVQAWVRKCSYFLRFLKNSPSTFRHLNFSSHSQIQMPLNDESFFCYLLTNSSSSLKEWSPLVPSPVALIAPYRLFWAIKTLGPPAAHTHTAGCHVAPEPQVERPALRRENSPFLSPFGNPERNCKGWVLGNTPSRVYFSPFPLRTRSSYQVRSSRCCIRLLHRWARSRGKAVERGKWFV